MRRALRLLPIVWLLLLLLLPAGAYVAGARQPDLENRPKTVMPDLNRGTLRNEATFKQLDHVLLDRLPFRGDALDARGRIAVDVFKDSPNPDVLIGSGGWYYFRPELGPCEPATAPSADPADAAEILARTLTASGRRTGVMVAGSKMVTHPQDLPSVDAEQLACLKDTEHRIQERLARVPGGIDLRAPLERREQDGDPTFLRTDTHWNATGRELFLRTVLDRVRPGLAAEVGVRRGTTIDRPGDFGPLLGVPRSEDDATIVVDRQPTRPLEPGKVLLIGDSQLERAMLNPVGAPSIHDAVLPDQPVCNWSDVVAGQCDAVLDGAKTVVVETVSRELKTFVNTCGRLVSVAGRDLRGTPARWRRLDGQAATATTLKLDTGTASVGIELKGQDEADVPRLLRIPVRRLPSTPDDATPPAVSVQPEAGNGPAPACVSPSQTVAGQALLLPVPAGQRVADVRFLLSGPTGAVLGTPETIVLRSTPAGGRP